MAAKEAPETTLVVLESFVGRIGTEDRYFGQGEHIRPTDPAVKKWPQFFGPVRYAHESGRVEQATAAPGEKRS